MNQRRHTRVTVDVVAEILLPDGELLYGEAANLSMDGAYVLLPSGRRPAVGAACTLRLHLESHGRRGVVDFDAQVVRCDEDGTGLQFRAANADAYGRLLALLEQRAVDLDTVLEELARDPGAGFRVL